MAKPGTAKNRAHWLSEAAAERLAMVSIAAVGVLLGAGGAYLAGQGLVADASTQSARQFRADARALRDADLDDVTAAAALYSQRARYVEALSEAAERLEASTPNKRSVFPLKPGTEERLKVPEPPPRMYNKGRPKIIIVFDDIGLDKSPFNQLMDLPGPITFSFLPYPNGLQKMADRANARGDGVMLHLPMEPLGLADPGPHALTNALSPSDLKREIAWNLARFDGYVGVNNHMGSAFTANPRGMATVFSALKERDVFFLDSLTTEKSVAAKVGRSDGAQVFLRDVFLDPDESRATVVRQLGVLEKIARETGYAVAIGHPRETTLEAIGPWLTTAPLRGFELATVETLLDIDAGLKVSERETVRLDALAFGR
ncbi:MAG: divergent polysaccharide deacetylase family protein [Pseudomonadota bacterium]